MTFIIENRGRGRILQGIQQHAKWLIAFLIRIGKGETGGHHQVL